MSLEVAHDTSSIAHVGPTSSERLKLRGKSTIGLECFPDDLLDVSTG